jgi:hypothetical protein
VRSEAYPSPTDISLAAWPDAFYLLVSAASGAPIAAQLPHPNGQVIGCRWIWCEAESGRPAQPEASVSNSRVSIRLEGSLMRERRGAGPRLGSRYSWYHGRAVGRTGATPPPRKERTMTDLVPPSPRSPRPPPTSRRTEHEQRAEPPSGSPTARGHRWFPAPTATRPPLSNDAYPDAERPSPARGRP